MGTLSERDGMRQEMLRLGIANRLMEEEMKRLQPDLTKYENCVHPAARPVQSETVSTSSLDEKTKGIKQDTSNLKIVENHLSTLNNQVATLFNEVGTKATERDSLFSEIEHATAQMNTLTLGISQFEEDSANVRNAVKSDSSQLKSMTSIFQDRLQEKASKLAKLKNSQSELDTSSKDRQERIKILEARNAELASKMDLDSLAQLKGKLGEITKKSVTLNEYLAAVTRDEGERLESLTSSITECEIMKKKKEELSKQLAELDSREKETVVEMDEKKKQVEELQIKLTQLEAKKELLTKNNEIAMTGLKELTDPLIESLKIKKEAAESEHEAVKKRIENREECLRLRMELEAEGKVEKLDLSREMEALKQEIEATRANITKAIGETEYYRSAAAKCNAEADEMQLTERRRRETEDKRLYEKDGVANHYEREIFLLKKKLEQEKIEREDRLAQETRRLLEKAKEEKERKEKEEKRRLEKEKEKMKRKAREEEEKKLKKMKDEEEKKLKKMKEEEEKKLKKVKEEEEKKLKRAKEEEEKKLKRAKDEQEKKKREETKDKMSKEAIPTFVSRVNQRRMNMESVAGVPLAYKDTPVMKPPVVHVPVPVPVNVRTRSIPLKPMFIYDDDSSEDDDEDDFLLNDRVMPKIPEKYAGSPPQVNKQTTPRNPFELSFTGCQSSTPVRTENNPAPAFELSFNEVVTSTPQIQRGSKTNKKQTRARGKKKSK